MDTTELKKKLARLKKAYRSKESVLKKVERRVNSKEHVRKRVEEEAKKNAESEGEISARKPVKVKFEQEVVGECEDERMASGEVEQTELKVSQGNTVHTVDSKSNKATCSENLAFTSADAALCQPQFIDVKDQTSVTNSSEADVHCLDDVHIDENSNEAAIVLNSEGSISTPKKDAETCGIPKSMKPLESDGSEKPVSHGNNQSTKKSKPRQNMLDYSFLDEEHDLYSQVKKRRRSSLGSPSLDQFSQLSQPAKPPKKKTKSPKVKVEKRLKEGNEKATKKAASSKADYSPNTNPVKEIFEVISSHSDLTSQESFSLPEQLVCDVKLSDRFIGPPSVSSGSEKSSPLTHHSLPADMKITTSADREKSSPLYAAPLDFNSQIDFKSQKNSTRRSKVTRKVKPYKQKQKRGTKSTLAATKNSSADKAAESKTGHSFTSCVCFETQGEAVLQVECCEEGVVTCTSSAVTLWHENEGLWTPKYTLPVDSCGSRFERCLLLTSRNVVVASHNPVSLVYHLVALDKEQPPPVLLYEVPFQATAPSGQSPGHHRILMSRLSPTDLLLAHPPHALTEQHRSSPTQLVHVSLSSALEEVTGTRELPTVEGKILSVMPVKGCVAGVFAAGVGANSVYIWNVQACVLVQEIASPYKLLHAAGAIAEQGLLFMACTIDDPTVGGGGLLAINPATAKLTLLTKLDTGALWQNRKKRWHCMTWDGPLIAASTTNCTAVFSAYSGHLVAHSPATTKLCCLNREQSRAVFTLKDTVKVFCIPQQVHSAS